MLSKQTRAHYQQECLKHKQRVKCQMPEKIVFPLNVSLDFVRLCISSRNVTLSCFHEEKEKKKEKRNKTEEKNPTKIQHICMFCVDNVSGMCICTMQRFFFYYYYFTLSGCLFSSPRPLQAKSAALGQWLYFSV